MTFMKKIFIVFSLLVAGYSTVSALSFFDNTSSVYTRDENKAVQTSDLCADDPLRCGMNNPGSSIRGLYYSGPIRSVYEAQNQTLSYVHNIVNRALSLLGLIALCYLLYSGFIIITGAGDEAKTKKGRKGLKTATLAIAGIAISWLLVSLIVYLIDLFIQ